MTQTYAIVLTNKVCALFTMDGLTVVDTVLECYGMHSTALVTESIMQCLASTIRHAAYVAPSGACVYTGSVANDDASHHGVDGRLVIGYVWIGNGSSENSTLAHYVAMCRALHMTVRIPQYCNGEDAIDVLPMAYSPRTIATSAL